MARRKTKTAPTLDELALEFVQVDPADAAQVARFADTVELATSAADDRVRAALVAVVARLRSVASGASADAFADVNEAGLLLEAAMWPEAAVAPAVPLTGPTTLVPDRLPGDFDADLVTGYAAEALEYLEGAEAALLVLEQSPDDEESINTVFRAFHTLKGTSAFLGLERTTDLAHRAESLLSPVRDRLVRMDGHITDLALRSIDILKSLTRGAQGAGAGADIPIPAGYAELIASLSMGEEEISEDEADAIFAAAAANRQSKVQEPAAVAESGRDRVASGPSADVTASKGTSEGTGDTWVRVRTDRLDQLVDIVGELVIAETMIAQDPGVGVEPELVKKVSHAGKIVRELQDLSIAMRMVPLKSTFQKLARLVRDLSRKSGKAVEFVTEGEDTEIDRNMVEIISDPLVHMIRNAVDHGIETPDARIAAGKSRAGTVRLSAYHAGGEVVVELADDGRGLDRNRILAKAVEKGLVEPDRHLSDREVFSLIFAPGFSTADKVTEVSGRGVGMDVVRRNVEAMRGRVEISSSSGSGTTFSVRFPLTLAITDGMLIRVGAERYIIPTASIHLSFRPERSALSTVTGRGEVVLLRDELMPILRLHRLLKVTGAREDATEALLVVVGHGEKRIALMVDELLGQHQVVAKSLGETIGKVGGVSGGAILGDGRVGLILDVGELLALAQNGDASKARRAAGAQAA